jgi:hypothetical protein
MGHYSPMISVIIEIYKIGVLGQSATLQELRTRLPNINVRGALDRSIDLGSVEREFFGHNNNQVKYVISAGSRQFVQQLCVDSGVLKVTEEIIYG